MKKILITGGAGFIGYHLANHLSKNNNNLTPDLEKKDKEKNLKIENETN